MSNLETYAVAPEGTPVPSADPQLGTLDGAESPESPESLETPSLQTDAGTRPEGLPENYESIEAMASALAEAQRKITELGQAAGETAEVPTYADLRAQAENEARSGGISEATAAAIEQHYGISKADQEAIVGDTIKAEEARAGQVLDLFGGEDGFSEFSKWAQESMTQEELGVLNDTIAAACKTGDMSVAGLTIQGAMSRYQGSQGPRVEEGSPVASASGIAPYANRQEAQQVIASEGYRLGDPKVHQLHQARLNISGGIFR